MFRPIIPLILLVMQSALHGQDPAGMMQKGDAALRAGLWELAALHYESALAVKSLPAAGKSEIAIRLAEAWVRDGKSADALDLLERSFVSKHPEASFWKGIALLNSGRLADAVTALTPYLKNPDSSLHDEAGFTIMSIQLALGNSLDALATLDTLAVDPASVVGLKARLHKVEILLDQDRHAEARSVMPAVDALEPAERPFAAFLEARLQFSEGDFTTAAAGFRQLLDHPQGQTSLRYHLAAVGLADAMLGLQQAADAASFLLTFIFSHQDSSQLPFLFARLLECLPDKPSPADPILERLAEWTAPCESPATGVLTPPGESAASVWPHESAAPTDFQAQAMLARSIGLHRIPTPEARAQANLLLTRLRLELPGTQVADRALFQTAFWKMEDGDAECASFLLDALRATGCSTETRGRAAFDQAAQAYQQGDYELARSLFDHAAAALNREDAKLARFNAAIVGLAVVPGMTPVVNPKPPIESSIAPDLELERALSTRVPDARRAAIEEFLSKYPDHPRMAEARIAAAEAALVGSKPDLSFARAQLDTIQSTPENAGEIPASRLDWLGLRILDRSNDPAATVEAARAFLENHPAADTIPDATFILGRNLFESHNYNDARLTLEGLAVAHPDSPLAQASWLLAARSAALVPTTQSQQEALTLFDNILESKDSAVAPLAMLEKGQLLIDMNRLQDAAVFLGKWFKSLKPADPLHLPAGLLLGEAIYAQGSENPASLTDALAVYDELLVQAEKDAALFNRIQYLRGKTLEQIPDPENPARKREKEAFIAYYSVLEKFETPEEWHYFELCGFRALALLEKAGRWPAAIACAKKIASFKGPRSEEAATHASDLQLKHMIWED